MQPLPKKVGPFTWISLVLTYAIIPLIMVYLGKDPYWWQAWAYSILVFAAGVGGRWFAEQRNPGLMAERINVVSRGDIKTWDKLLMPLIVLTLAYPSIVIAGLDHAMRWSGPFPLWVNWVGACAVAIGYGISDWALLVNRYFSSMVRIQVDRGHEVVMSGPYAFIRHPAYAGNLLGTLGLVLLLDSTWAGLPIILNWVLTILRTWLEDKTLLADLPGYAEYAKQVPWRLVPFVW